MSPPAASLLQVTQQQRVQMVGEDSAAGMLERKGMNVLARNWRCKVGELDLIVMDGPTIVFVEVKCRSRDWLYDPSLAVDQRKQVRLRRVADAFISMERPKFTDCRFDVVSVVAGRPVTLSHFVNAF